MASKSHSSAAIAAPQSNILAFPTGNQGRVRRSNSVGSMGEVAMMQMLLDGEQPPANVERLDPMPEASSFQQSPELVLILAMLNALPKKQRREVEYYTRTNAIATKCPHFIAASNLLNGEALR